MPAIEREIITQLRQQALDLGFSDLGIAGIDLGSSEIALDRWLAANHHGEMAWMARHGHHRSRPAELVAGTLSILSLRMEYLPQAHDAWQQLRSAQGAYISRYALGRDYHKMMRKRLQQLASWLVATIGPFGYRVFVDSAPVLEKPIAAAAGLGWQGKHTNLLTRQGSWFFLGEIYTDLPLPISEPATQHCGHCQRCIDICPTAAITAPWWLDARRCISYLTIEHGGAIPLELRPLIGNRIYGCDDCQLICPWNRFARPSPHTDFAPRHQLDSATLLQLVAWDEATFNQRLEGSAIRRIGYTRWLRNIAVALGNAPGNDANRQALLALSHHAAEIVREHAIWALGHSATPRDPPPS
jgi:epoxyqueuosine reductase